MANKKWQEIPKEKREPVNHLTLESEVTGIGVVRDGSPQNGWYAIGLRETKHGQKFVIILSPEETEDLLEKLSLTVKENKEKNNERVAPVAAGDHPT